MTDGSVCKFARQKASCILTIKTRSTHPGFTEGAGSSSTVAEFTIFAFLSSCRQMIGSTDSLHPHTNYTCTISNCFRLNRWRTHCNRSNYMPHIRANCSTLLLSARDMDNWWHRPVCGFLPTSSSCFAPWTFRLLLMTS